MKPSLSHLESELAESREALDDFKQASQKLSAYRNTLLSNGAQPMMKAQRDVLERLVAAVETAKERVRLSVRELL